MLTGIKCDWSYAGTQAAKISRWVGCARVVYSGKCQQHEYERALIRKIPSVDRVEINKEFAFLKTENSPWLNDCPSGILRNAATIWYKSFVRFMRGQAKPPRPKKRGDGDYIWVTQDLFHIEPHGQHWRVWIGTESQRKALSVLGEMIPQIQAAVSEVAAWLACENIPEKLQKSLAKSKALLDKTLATALAKRQAIHDDPHTIGWVTVKPHRFIVEPPKSLWIKRKAGQWRLSFSYEDGHVAEPLELDAWRKHYQALSEAEALAMTCGIDRNVGRPFQTHEHYYGLSRKAKEQIAVAERKLRYQQKHLARQQKGSKARAKTKKKIGQLHERISNIRNDFLHKATTDLSLKEVFQVYALERLRLKHMTKRPKAKRCPSTGKWLRNRAKAKAALNRSMLGNGLGRFDELLSYKTARQGKVVVYINPQNTSRECAECGYIHENNRQKTLFHCLQCGHRDHADRNAGRVIRKRALTQLRDSGMELSDKGVLSPRSTLGSGFCEKPHASVRDLAQTNKTLRKTDQATPDRHCAA